MAADREAGLRHAISIVSGFTLIALTNAVDVFAFVPRSSGGLGLRAAHYLFDAAQTVGVGAALGALIGLWVAFVPAPLWASLGVYAGFATSVLGVVLGQNLERQAVVVWEGRVFAPLFVVYLAGAGLAIPTAHVMGAASSRFRYLGALPVVAALGGIVVNHIVLRDDYPDVHGAIGWGAATLAGAAIGPSITRALQDRASRRARSLVASAAALVAAFGLLVPPPNRVRIELFRQPGAMGAWLLAKTIWRRPAQALSSSSPSPAPSSPWFSDRAGAPPVPPSQKRLFTPPPVVVFLTIDAMRADVIADPQNDRTFPYLAGLKRRGAYFTNATSPGAQTAVSLTSVFSGRYFSELVWAMHGVGVARFAYAADDPAPRVPEILTAAGVRTMSSLSLNFLAGEFGVLRGFSEEVMVAEGRKHATAAPVLDPIIKRIEALDRDQPAFFYAHLTEPHAPYDRGSKKGSDKERYISEIGVADAQVGRVARALYKRFPDRWLLIISADHGEAFGEHGTVNHTKTLYEELLRVPLLVSGAGVRARRIDDHVSLMDIGPTLLDLFGVPTPAQLTGQSLVPTLRGEDQRFDRPIFAEGRLRRAYYAGSLKVIEDNRRMVIEAYDLARDPGETDELFAKDRARVEPALVALRAFFDARQARAPGYEPPFKP